MTPALQFIDALVKSQGDTLVINSTEPPFIFFGKQKNYLLKKPLTGETFRKLGEELRETFAGLETMTYSGREIGQTRENGAIHLKLAPIAEARLLERAIRDFGSEEKNETPAFHESVNLDVLLWIMVGKNASDLHLSTGCLPLLRVDGEIAVLEGHTPVT